MKIGIYAACLNEAKHISVWYESCKDADVIVVADTGSTDASLSTFKKLKIPVTNVCIKPWRFDTGFNIAMSLLPADCDVCIRLDFDERLQPGWREIIEDVWKPDTNRLRYTYVWNWINDRPGLTWLGDRIHSRNNFIWRGATHEGLVFRSGTENIVWEPRLKIHQYPDAKAKPNDLALLQEAVRESPTDARMQAYLAREYMYREDWVNSIATYKEFLTMSSDSVERGIALVNLSRMDTDNRVFWLRLAQREVPGHREPLVELANHWYQTQVWDKCLESAKLALAITVHPQDYSCTAEAWGALPWDLASIAAWNLKLYLDAKHYVERATELDPTNERIQNNKKLIEAEILSLNK